MRRPHSELYGWRREKQEPGSQAAQKTQGRSAVMVNTSESTSNSVIFMQNGDRKEQGVHLGVVFIKADRVTTSSSLCVQLALAVTAGCPARRVPVRRAWRPRTGATWEGFGDERKGEDVGCCRSPHCCHGPCGKKLFGTAQSEQGAQVQVPELPPRPSNCVPLSKRPNLSVSFVKLDKNNNATYSCDDN